MKPLPFDYAVRNLSRSPTRLALSLLGSALVVLLVLAAGAFVRGMRSSLDVTGSPDNVILLGAGSEESIERSEISAAVPSLVAAAVPGIKSSLGVAHASPEVHMQIALRTAQDGPEFSSPVRGVAPEALLVHGQVQILEGRLPSPGADEIMVGRLAATNLGLPEARLAIGEPLWLDGRPWTIVGRFAAPGTVMEGEVWAPVRDLMVATRRDTLSCVVLTLGEAEFADVDAFAKQRLDLELVAIRESEYYAKLSDFFAPVRAMVWATAGLIGAAGLFGGLNTMYAAFASRVREIGMLQSLGFARRAVVLSLVQESLLTAAAGSLLGAAVALLTLDGLAVRFSMGVFGLTVDAPVLAAGLIAGVILGIVGALPPAWRCLRLPIPEALKAS